MTPEQERKLDEAVRLGTETHRTVSDLATHMLGLHERVNGLERGYRTLKSWARRIMAGEDRPREKMPTLNPDDSGSIELSAFGAKAKVAGALPVRFGIGLILLTLVGAAGYGIRVATAKGAMPAAAASERK